MKLHIDKIDGVRGIAICLVVAYHTMLLIFPGYEFRTYNTQTGLIEADSLKTVLLNLNPLGQGWIGVDLFLVISGFLIHLIYLRSNADLNYSRFFSKRFWRIYPPYLFALLFFFIRNIDVTQNGLINISSHLLLIHNFTDRTFFSINSSFWSIALECQLYLIYPLYIFLLKKIGTRKALILTLAINFLFSLNGFFRHTDSLSYILSIFNFWFVWCSGAFLAEHFYNQRKVFRRPIATFLFFYLLVYVFKLFSATSYFTLVPAAIACVAFIEMTLYGDYMNINFVSKFLFGIISKIGLISYSIYLIHQPYLYDLLNFYYPRTSHLFLNRMVSLSFTMGTILCVSYALYKLVELKSIAYGQQVRAKLSGSAELGLPQYEQTNKG